MTICGMATISLVATGWVFLGISGMNNVRSSGLNNVPAFSGAEGFGRYTTGGRGGKVIIVDNLDDSGLGSLRNTLTKEYPGIIVFGLSGTIVLGSPLKVNHGDITNAGPSMPGDGICFKNLALVISAGNVIIGYIRIRVGERTEITGDTNIEMFINGLGE